MNHNRRQFIKVFGTSAVGLAASRLVRYRASGDMQWHNVESWGIEGKGWTDTSRYFDRLPAKANGVVREPVWNLSRHSAGMSVRFETDAQEISVRYELLSERIAMPHMPATGVSGLDLYVVDEFGKLTWLSILKPEAQKIEQSLVSEMPPGSRRFTLYLPLYNGVEQLEIGVPDGSVFTGIPPRSEKPMAFYGTSILHGACASRTGMAFPSILSRRLKKPILNLGFSGNGRMEPEVAELLAELDPSAYFIDCLPNMNAELVSERAYNLVKIIRSRRSATPITLVEDRMNANAAFRVDRVAHHLASRKVLRETFRKLRSEGLPYIYYLSGEYLIGTDGEGTTDGSHPNDLGMVRYADAYEPVIRDIFSEY